MTWRSFIPDLRLIHWPSFLLGWNLLGWIVIFAHTLGAAQ
jgi:hypothetical protein